MKNLMIVVLLVLLLFGCGEAYYDNVIGLTPMDEISGKTKNSMGNIFDNMSAIFANDSTI